MNNVYRMFDVTGELLYIGITNQGPRRFWQHSDNQPWWDLVAWIKVDHHDCERDELEQIERDAIVAERPRYNIRHNPDWEKAEQLLEELRARNDAAAIEAFRQVYRCRATTRTGRQCQNSVEIGFDTCCSHRPRVREDVA